MRSASSDGGGRALTGALLLALAWVLPGAGFADGWRAAPVFGADVRSLAFDPQSPGRVLAGTSSGQIYESTDMGGSWSTLGGRVALSGWVISDLQFDPHHPGRVWAGLWSLWGSDGAVVVSDDGGRSWQARDGGLPSQQVYALALATDRPDELWVATRDGVWASTDAGRSWRHATRALSKMGKVTSLLVDPYRPDVIYAGTWRRAYRSDDRGATWRGIFEGMVLDSEVFSLRPGPRGEGDLWASTCGWVYHGRDRGARWQRHTNGLKERRTPSFEVLADGTLLAGTVAGVYASTDQGASWRRRTPPVAVARIAAHPDRPEVVLVGSEGSGVWRSLDAGATFEPSAEGMVSVRVTDIVPAARGLELSVRYAERNDGVHRLSGGRVEIGRDSELPTVLDLEADGERLLAGAERGLWQRTDAAWRPVDGLTEERVEQVAVGGGRVVARTPSEIVSVTGSEIERFALARPAAGPVWWEGAAWFVDGGALRRWDGDGVAEAATPGAVESVEVFGARLVVEGPEGRLQRTAGGPWMPLPVAASRVLPTGDDELPILGLWRDGSATLHDSRGTARTRLRLPVPARDVSASVLEHGRLHLATAGYGLLWSNVLLLDEAPATGDERVEISSR